MGGRGQLFWTRSGQVGAVPPLLVPNPFSSKHIEKNPEPECSSKKDSFFGSHTSDVVGGGGGGGFLDIIFGAILRHVAYRTNW